MRVPFPALLLIALAACSSPAARIEGTEPGDCTDGADNDADGLFDCDDSTCAAAPSCVREEDGGVGADAGESELDAGSDAGATAPIDGATEDADSPAAVDAASDGSLDGGGPTAPLASWAHQFGGEATLNVTDIAIDSEGNIVVVGNFDGTMNFGGADLVSADQTTFIASLRPDATHRWSRAFVATPSDGAYATALSTDAAGHIYIGGQFRGTVNFGGGPIVAAGSTDIYVTSFSASGTHRWTRAWTQPAGVDTAFAIASPPSGGCFVTGWFHDTIDFGGGPLVSAGGEDIFLLALNESGTHLWSRRFGGTGDDDGVNVAVDEAGAIYLASSSNSSIDFGGGPLAGGDSFPAALSSFAPGGTHVWSRLIGTGGSTNVRDLDARGTTVLVSGEFGGRFAPGTVDFGPGAGSVRSMGDQDVFVLGVNGATGSSDWLRVIAGPATDSGGVVGIDSAGGIVTSGKVVTAGNFGATEPVIGTGIFVATYGPGGVYESATLFGGIASTDTEIAPDDDAIVAGVFGGVADFGLGPLVAVGGSDFFLARFDR